MQARSALSPSVLLACAASAAAQGAAFQSPGLPTYGASGQTDRFSNEFNPAVGIVADALADYVESQSTDEGDGVDLGLRAFELTGQAWLDPKANAYAVIALEDLEELALEEMAIRYVGFGDTNFDLKAGRFFVDFGKQMQIHVHDLRTVERPLVLRAYLGDELGGDGVQLDHWFGVGDETPLRWSFGVYRSLLGEEEDPFEPAAVVADRKDADELHLAARATALVELSDASQLQVGGSWRHVPRFDLELEASGDEADRLSNDTFGIDLTYGRVDETGTERLTVGGEVLWLTGDVGGSAVDAGGDGDPTNDTVAVLDETLFGAYAFADWQWNRFDSVGVQWSGAQIPEAGRDDTEIEVYWTHLFSEFHRLRLAMTAFDSDRVDDELRWVVQYTGFLGPHAHGINW